jgi:acetolactate synthase-1/2/3 large subunit
VDQVGAARPVTKAAWLADAPASLDRDVEAAWTLATAGRPGPVHVSLPTDVLEHAPPPPQAPPSHRPSPPDAPTADDARLREALARLSAAVRPLILVGPAMGRGARWQRVTRLAALTGIPALAMESPRGVNDPALRAATRCLARADRVLLLGKRLDFALRFGEPPAFAPECRFLQVDWEGEPPPARVELALTADPGDAADRLIELATGATPSHSAWADEVARATRATPPAWDELARSSRVPIHPLRVCAALQPFLDPGGILVSDGGEFGQWAQAGLRAGTRLINGPSGSIGSALPMGLAARLRHPDRAVFVTLGDGTFGYAALELDTALRYGLPVVAVVGNDARWNAEYQLQLRHYGAERAVGCELAATRYDRLTEALGGHGEFVEHPRDLTPALERAIASGRPACVNVRIEGAPAPTFPAA